MTGAYPSATARRGATGSKYLTFRGGLRRAIPYLLARDTGIQVSRITVGGPFRRADEDLDVVRALRDSLLRRLAKPWERRQRTKSHFGCQPPAAAFLASVGRQRGPACCG